MTLMPEDRRIIVLRSGIWNGFIGIIPRGGQEFPNSIVGDKLL